MSQVNNCIAATGTATSTGAGQGMSNTMKSLEDLYIYELPYTCRQELCRLLDSLNVWQQLAKVFQLYERHVQQIMRHQNAGNSPSEELLNIWGRYNHRVTELFAVFLQEKHFAAMCILKPYVDKKYHKYIVENKPDSSKILNRSNNDTRDNNITNDFNGSSYQNSNRNEAEGSNFLDPNHIDKYASSLIEIDYAELSAATNNWSKQNELGKGGFGTVYKGNWKYTLVAIKQIHYSGSSDHESEKVQIQQSLNELKYLNECRHDNVVPLYGYSIKGDKPCLVYQLCKGGSLHERLYRKTLPPLTWQERMDICFNTARGINYLHTFRQKPLIHGDIKPANILLDDCLRPKIGDFGLAREGPNAINISVQVSQPVGTRFYLPPEYRKLRKLSTKVDIYSFGLVLLETFTGMRIYDENRAFRELSDHVRELSKNAPIRSLIHNNLPLPNARAEEMCIKTIQTALHCISPQADQRPEMEQVLNELSCYVDL